VNRETQTNVQSDRVKMWLSIQVEKIDYDPTGAVMRISGKNVSESKYVKVCWSTKT
jgi:stalled ribosome rescue protein Dom34